MLEDRYAEALPAGYRLGSYRIESVLGQGGFGITYRAFDTREQKVVAIKEFFPSRTAAREAGSRVCPSSGSAVDDFSYGLRRFISEAETLTQFNHPSIVKVSRLMTANDTAYMVMSYEEGESLASLLDRSPKGLEDQEIVRLLAGIVDGLDLVHRTEHLHRDIAPDNIIIRRDRTPVLIDFGAVRYLCSQKSGSTAAIIKRGYSPPEQYASVTDRQGPWTDIYALGAVAYRCIGGLKLPNSMDRQHSVAETGVDPLIPAATLGKGRYSPALLHAIDRALALKCSDRPQSAKQWLAMFSPPAPPPTEAQREARPPRPSSLRRLWDSVFSTRQRRDKGSAPAAPAASIGGLPSTAAAPPAAGDAAEGRSWTLSGQGSTGAPIQVTVHESALRRANGRLVIGRDESVSDIVIVDETVSRRHAVLSLAENRLCIEDANSLNGTAVDDVPIMMLFKPVPVHDRARIRLGGVHLVLTASHGARNEA